MGIRGSRLLGPVLSQERQNRGGRSRGTARYSSSEPSPPNAARCLVGARKAESGLGNAHMVNSSNAGQSTAGLD